MNKRFILAVALFALPLLTQPLAAQQIDPTATPPPIDESFPVPQPTATQPQPIDPLPTPDATYTYAPTATPPPIDEQVPITPMPTIIATVTPAAMFVYFAPVWLVAKEQR